MTGKINIALCISGEGRSSMFCFPYIYQHFMKLSSKFNVDIFIHSWKGYRAIELYNPYGLKIDSNYHNTFLKQHIVDKMGIEDFIEYNTIKNAISMAASIKQCFNLPRKPYDMYIRIRPDLIFPHQFNSEHIFNNFYKDDYDVYMPKPTRDNYEVGAGYNDQLAILNYKGMLQYGKLLETITKHYDKNLGNFAEGYLKRILDEGKLKIKHCSNWGNNVLVRSTEITHNMPRSFIYLDE